MWGLASLRNFRCKLNEFTFQLASLKGQKGFEDLWKKHSGFPRRVCLSLSLLCNSNCIYCAQRGKAIKNKLMPFELLKKILAELKANDFKGEFSLSEGGEALTHPEFKPMVEAIRQKFPENKLWLYSNMILMDEAMAKFLLEQKLSFLHFNFDGGSEKNYDYIKRNAKFEQVKANIQKFLKLRNALRSPCSVQIGIIEAKRYAQDIEGRPGVFESDYRQIKKLWAPYLRWGDCISREPIFLLPHQFTLKRKKQENCHLFKRLLSDIFIAPDGNVYICCFDFGVTSSLGNVREQEISRLWMSESRKEVMRNLFLRNFDNLFEVCRTCLPHPDSVFPSQRRANRELQKAIRKSNRA